jgi:Zn-dependent peptidase ImmA (M78 family)/transcriptional regulator with XRE-family HTH domain
MFSGRRIRQAREVRRLTQSELAKKVGVGQSAIAHVERGFKNPSRALMTKIAMQTHFPVSFFTNDPLREFPVQSLLFRAKASMSKRDAAEACRYAELLNEIAEGMASQLTAIRLALPTSIGDPVVAAKQTRLVLQIPPDEPIPHLINAVERAGVLILALPATLAGRDAFTLWVERQSVPLPVIATSRERPGDRLRLSVAHELGHLVMGHSPKLDPDQEKRAFTFGAELLMPETAMRREIASPITLSSIAVLKPRWRVSVQALIRRAYDLHLASERQYRYLFEQLSIKGWRAKEPSNLDIPVEKPRGLRQMAELVYGRPIDYERMSADTHFSAAFLRGAMEEYAESPGVEEKRENASGRVISFAKP